MFVLTGSKSWQARLLPQKRSQYNPKHVGRVDQLHRAPPPAPPAPPKGAGLPSAEASGSRLATVAHNQKEPACATLCRGDGNRLDDWLSALRLEYIRVTHCSLCFPRLSTVRGLESLLQYKALLGTLQVLPGLQVGPLSSPCVLSFLQHLLTT